jgi:signal transduction histidine kinase
MTIRTRLALWYSGLLTLIIVIFSISVITVSRVTLLQTVDQVLATAAQTVISIIDPVPVAEFGPADTVEIFFRSQDIFHAPGISVQVWRTRNNGELIEPLLEHASADMSGFEHALDPSFLTTHSVHFNSTTISDVPGRVITQPFFTESGELLGVVQIATPLRAIVDANDQLLIITLISAIICILVSIWLGRWLSSYLLRPIATITHAAASVSTTQDLSTRLEWQGANDELGELTRVYNHMMARLEKLFSVQQRFISDVSHELRTPLTTIIGNTELMDRYGMDKESLEAIQREAERMSRMVNDLLLLTRADSGEMTIDLYPVDLDGIVLEVYEQSLGLAKGRNLQILLDRLEPVRMEGNTDRLRQLLLNLISNAIKFTEDGGRIKLSAYPDGNHAVLEVEDTGIGISKADQERIFDRFFQADAARARRDDLYGAGLGLSIARWIVDIHGGTISIQSEPEKGSRFTIRMPIERVDRSQHIQSANGVTQHVKIRSKQASDL